MTYSGDTPFEVLSTKFDESIKSIAILEKRISELKETKLTLYRILRDKFIPREYICNISKENDDIMEQMYKSIGDVSVGDCMFDIIWEYYTLQISSDPVCCSRKEHHKTLITLGLKGYPSHTPSPYNSGFDGDDCQSIYDQMRCKSYYAFKSLIWSQQLFYCLIHNKLINSSYVIGQINSMTQIPLSHSEVVIRSNCIKALRSRMVFIRYVCNIHNSIYEYFENNPTINKCTIPTYEYMINRIDDAHNFQFTIQSRSTYHMYRYDETDIILCDKEHQLTRVKYMNAINSRYARTALNKTIPSFIISNITKFINNCDALIALYEQSCIGSPAFMSYLIDVKEMSIEDATKFISEH